MSESDPMSSKIVFLFLFNFIPLSSIIKALGYSLIVPTSHGFMCRLVPIAELSDLGAISFV